MYMPILRAPATKIVFNATGQQYRQTTSFTYLRGFKRYKRELYGRPEASLLLLKARMVKSEVVEASYTDVLHGPP